MKIEIKMEISKAGEIVFANLLRKNNIYTLVDAYQASEQVVKIYENCVVVKPKSEPVNKAVDGWLYIKNKWFAWDVKVFGDMKNIGFLKEEIIKYKFHDNVLIVIYDKSSLKKHLSNNQSMLSASYHPEILITTNSIGELNEEKIHDPARGRGEGYIIKKDGAYPINNLFILTKNGEMLYKRPKQSEKDQKYSIEEAIIELMNV